MTAAYSTLTTAQLATLTHQAEDTENDVLLLQVMTEVENRERKLTGYHMGIFLPEYRKQIYNRPKQVLEKTEQHAFKIVHDAQEAKEITGAKQKPFKACEALFYSRSGELNPITQEEYEEGVIRALNDEDSDFNPKAWERGPFLTDETNSI